jgi:predicted small integral membrane protein
MPSPEVTAAGRTPGHCTRKDRLGAAILAGLGAAYGELVCIGIVGIAYGEETWADIFFVVLFVGTASYVFFEEVSRLAHEALGIQEVEVPGHRKPWVAALIGGMAFVLVAAHIVIETGAGRDKSDTIGILVISLLTAGTITLAWVNGAREDPPCAARRGVARGLFIGLVFSLFLIAAMAVKGALPGSDPPPNIQMKGAEFVRFYKIGFVGGILAFLTAYYSLIGLIGGIAIDKRLTKSPARSALYGLAGVALIPIALFLYLSMSAWEPDTLQLAFGLWGWGFAMVLKDKTFNRLLASPDEAAGAVALQAEHPHADGWLPALGFGAAMAILLVIVTVKKGPSVIIKDVHFFESGTEPGDAKDRDYARKFRQDKTRFIYYELGLKKKIGGTPPEVPVMVSWRIQPTNLQAISAGPQVGSYRDNLSISDTPPANRFQGIHPGDLPLGTYTVMFYDKNNPVGSGEFEITAALPEIESVIFYVGPRDLTRDGSAGPHFREDGASEIKYHVHLSLASSQDMPLKMTWYRIAETGEPEPMFDPPAYTITAGSSDVRGLAQPQERWTPGHYRADFFFADQAARSFDFYVDPAPAYTDTLPAR